MSVHEALASTEARAEEILQATTAEERAAGMADHWRAFSNGNEHHFFTYFMLDAHAEVRRLFLESIEASEEIPYPNDVPQAVIKTGRAILWATTQGYENGDPFAISYSGQRIYPIE